MTNDKSRFPFTCTWTIRHFSLFFICHFSFVIERPVNRSSVVLEGWVLLAIEILENSCRSSRSDIRRQLFIPGLTHSFEAPKGAEQNLLADLADAGDFIQLRVVVAQVAPFAMIRHG